MIPRADGALRYPAEAPPWPMDASGAQRFRFCPRCGACFDLQRIEDRERLVCTACAFVYYQDPTVGMAVLLERLTPEGAAEVLLTLRRYGRGAGRWDLPGGWVEYDEDLRAAARELREETGLDVAVGHFSDALSNFHTPELHTVGIWFRDTFTSGALAAGDDASDARYFPLGALPELAFPTDRRVLARRRAEAAARAPATTPPRSGSGERGLGGEGRDPLRGRRVRDGEGMDEDPAL